MNRNNTKNRRNSGTGILSQHIIKKMQGFCSGGFFEFPAKRQKVEQCFVTLIYQSVRVDESIGAKNDDLCQINGLKYLAFFDNLEYITSRGLEFRFDSCLAER
ncbi:MAG: hypothetical protein GY858_09970 [Candidatus Omnitrophica bacterium]|nr:hypothetical protein [Candidatus Omnitrophota bacterium]